jgi:hypothetical protein
MTVEAGVSGGVDEGVQGGMAVAIPLHSEFGAVIVPAEVVTWAWNRAEPLC